MAPILDAVSPVRSPRSWHSTVDKVDWLADLRAENAALRAKTSGCWNWQTVARQLEAENRAAARSC